MIAAHVTATGAWFRLPFPAAPWKLGSWSRPLGPALRACVCSFPHVTSSGVASAARGFCTISADRCRWDLAQRGALHKLALWSHWRHPRTFCSRSFGCSESSLAGALHGPLLVLLQHRQSRRVPHAQPDKADGLPLLPLEAYDSYRRQIRHSVEQAVGPQRQAEFRSLRLVTRSMSGLHATFLLVLLGAPPTSLELLLAPHAQFCCLCLAQAVSATFWGFGLARPGPLAVGGLAIGDWRLAMGLLYLWICGVALVASLKDPKTSYAIQISALSLFLVLQRRLGSPLVAALPAWWTSGTHRQMLLVLLACICTALGRAVYIGAQLDSIMDGALRD